MEWREHYKLKGKHAVLSMSQHSWMNYDEQKLRNYIHAQEAKVIGTRKHALAAELIDMGIRLPDEPYTLNMYVNNAIDYGMRTEQILYYSDNVFGTADAIQFWNAGERWILRIHDYKSGEHEAEMEQLYGYAALFCLEYDVDPADILIICEIYQNNSIRHDEPGVDIIRHIMDLIVDSDRIINEETRSTVYVI